MEKKKKQPWVRKRHKILLEILKHHADTHLLLIGPVTAQWYLDELQRDAVQRALEKRLTVIPGLPPDSRELLQALKSAYCFILPSRHEPFGIAALEALDANLPLIASAVGGLRDFLVNGENALLFEDNNTVDFLKAYSQLDALKNKLVAGGEATAKMYNWQSIAGKLSDIYRELLK